MREAAATAAADAALADLAAGAGQALTRVIEARQEAARAAALAAAGPARATRHTWLRAGERACPLLTQHMRPPAAVRRIAALRRPDGSLCSDPMEMPSVMVKFWQSVCTAAATDPAARAQVLGALRAAGLS